MGQDVDRITFSRHDRQRYRANVHRCLDALTLMLREHTFDSAEPMTGLEVELNLVGELLEPALVADAVLDSLGSPEFQSELGRWNLELNLPPRPLPASSGATSSSSSSTSSPWPVRRPETTAPSSP